MGIWSFAGACLAAVIAGFFLRELKISEFRQKWIDELRKDIAEFIREARFSMLDRTGLAIKSLSGDLASANDTIHAHQAFEVLCRIKLRINPRESDTQEEDKNLLDALDGLICTNSGAKRDEWHKAAEGCVTQAREILKREWEITKRPWIRWGRSLRSLFCAIKKRCCK